MRGQRITIFAKPQQYTTLKGENRYGYLKKLLGSMTHRLQLVLIDKTTLFRFRISNCPVIECILGQRCQHGFMRGKSTVSNLLEFVGHVFESFSQRRQLDVIYTDFSKAFDMVNHRLLLYKLDVLGFPPILLDRSYLHGRTQRVAFKDSSSMLIRVTYGVPQGRMIFRRLSYHRGY
ncbi:uncharacterized protein LOC142231243 [Haematobia irritans]|uniref:uncharacterized protein LOC142231243 n=1 Tax=Haematobia irritans TaxID=7368 RepID=UPI003F4F8CD0